MRRLLIIVWVSAVLQVAGWAFVPPPPAVRPLPGSDRAFGPTEKYAVDSRESQRQNAFRALEQPTGSRCTVDGRKAFIGGLSEYYYHRQNQTERYPETFGQPGADYIAEQWSGTDDKRIDRLTREAYGMGYLKPDDFEAVARKMFLAVVRNERVASKGCSG